MKKFLRFYLPPGPPLLPGILLLAYLPLARLLLVCLFFSACKSRPPAIPPSMLPTLVFSGITADDPGLLHISFNLNTDNPFPYNGRVKIESWHVLINGQKAGAGFSLDFPGSGEFPLNAATSASYPLTLDMDVAILSALSLAPADDYNIVLALELDFAAAYGLADYAANDYKTTANGKAAGDRKAAGDSFPSVKAEVKGAAAFPGVRPPEFSITAIAILKAELINTRFRVGLKIDNPNPFPVDLSAFAYELYGNGRLWADGTEKNVFQVKGNSSLEGSMFLIMNFINMKRDLLDQIIRLEDVNYRFAGEVQVGTGVDYLPEFITGFDLSGYSQVLEN